jgi:hypothetical protein
MRPAPPVEAHPRLQVPVAAVGEGPVPARTFSCWALPRQTRPVDASAAPVLTMQHTRSPIPGKAHPRVGDMTWAAHTSPAVVRRRTTRRRQGPVPPGRLPSCTPDRPRRPQSPSPSSAAPIRARMMTQHPMSYLGANCTLPFAVSRTEHNASETSIFATTSKAGKCSLVGLNRLPSVRRGFQSPLARAAPLRSILASGSPGSSSKAGARPRLAQLLARTPPVRVSRRNGLP